MTIVNRTQGFRTITLSESTLRGALKRSQVEALSLAQLETLRETLLDLAELSDWVDWLEANGLR
ncbi:MAG: DUF4351 domain-containing protein [Acaryochloris sp. RU_4_1]|nr:DUF4351 domain-containing protein [Acaryochloris sp. RU_4_1]